MSLRLIAGATMALAAFVAGGCSDPEPGIHLANRSNVSLAIGFSDGVPPCSTVFLPQGEIDDFTRDLVPGALRPDGLWLRPEGSPSNYWVIASEGPTQVLDSEPGQLPPCGGPPLGWS